jgi:hypothetical protein
MSVGPYLVPYVQGYQAGVTVYPMQRDLKTRR